jgi:hypothetical protein
MLKVSLKKPGQPLEVAVFASSSSVNDEHSTGYQTAAGLCDTVGNIQFDPYRPIVSRPAPFDTELLARLADVFSYCLLLEEEKWDEITEKNEEKKDEKKDETKQMPLLSSFSLTLLPQQPHSFSSVFSFSAGQSLPAARVPPLASILTSQRGFIVYSVRHPDGCLIFSQTTDSVSPSSVSPSSSFFPSLSSISLDIHVSLALPTTGLLPYLEQWLDETEGKEEMEEKKTKNERDYREPALKIVSVGFFAHLLVLLYHLMVIHQFPRPAVGVSRAGSVDLVFVSSTNGLFYMNNNYFRFQSLAELVALFQRYRKEFF